MLYIESTHVRAARDAATAEDVQALLHQAIRLEHATIPPYLAAVFSLTGATNQRIRRAIHKIAVEEMLHMGTLANILNAIGGRPEIDRPDFVPAYPTSLPMSVGDGLVVGIRSFSKALVHTTFMQIEEPETPIHFPVPAVAAGGETFATIGEFYRALAAKLTELGDPIFTGDPSRQVTESGGLVAITDAKTAVEQLERVILEGEGTDTQPLDIDGELAHYYRFEEIYRGRALVEDQSSALGYSFSGPEIPFAAAGVVDFPDNPKAADYVPGSVARDRVDAFNRLYSDLLRLLQRGFDGSPELVVESEHTMRDLRASAHQLVTTTDPSTNKPLGPTFEYVPE